MPELPEVETVVRTLESQIAGQTIRSATILKSDLLSNISIDEFVKNIVGQTFLTFSRRGKWLIFGLNDYTLCVHLRMEGKFYVGPQLKSSPYAEAIFELDDVNLIYDDMRGFGKFNLYRNGEEPKCLADIGPEPWDDSLTPEYLTEYCKRRRMPIKAQLLDQKMIAGIGNIYSNEICWDVKINPFTPAKDIAPFQWEQIISSARRILTEAIINKGTTIRSYTSSLGVKGGNQFSLHVYGRQGQPCHRCAKPIVRTEISGRGTFYCPHCQEQQIITPDTTL